MLPSNGGSRMYVIKYPPNQHVKNRTNKENRLPPGRASVLVIATRTPHHVTKIKTRNKNAPTWPCGGHRNMNFNRSQNVGLFGNGFCSVRSGVVNRWNFWRHGTHLSGLSSSSSLVTKVILLVPTGILYSDFLRLKFITSTMVDGHVVLFYSYFYIFLIMMASDA